jgi:hypothetical protein
MLSKIGATISTESAFENSAGVVLTISIEKLTETQGYFSGCSVYAGHIGGIGRAPAELSCD